MQPIPSESNEDKQTIFDQAVSYTQAGQKELANRNFKALRAADPDNVDLILWIAETEKEITNVRIYLKRAEFLAGDDDPRIIAAWEKYEIRKKEPWFNLKPGRGLAIGFLITWFLTPSLSLVVGTKLAAVISLLLFMVFWRGDTKPHWIIRYGVGIISFLPLYNLLH